MRIAVLVKQVPDTRSVQMDEETGTVIRKGSEAILNPLDAYALQAALQLRQLRGGALVHAFSMGPPSAEQTLKEVLALGADRASLISDRACAGSDTWATAQVLAAALQKLGPFDLVVCGERATDGDTGQVGPEIAACLNLGMATFVEQILDLQEDWLDLRRKTESGFESWRLRLPGLLTVTKAIGEIALPTLANKMAARRAQVPLLKADELGLDPESIGLKGSPTRVVKIFYPSLTRKGELYKISDETSLLANSRILAKYLREAANK